MAIYGDPKTNKHIGIYCDWCGTILRDKFTYYSGKFDLVEVDAATCKQGIKDVDRGCMDIDICPTCFAKMKKTMLNIINKRQQSGTWTTDTGKT